MGSAGGDLPVFLEKPAGHVEHGVHQEILPVPAEAGKRDALGVAHQPGSFVIERLLPLIEAADDQGNRQGTALRAEARAGWGAGHEWELVYYSSGGYTCEIIHKGGATVRHGGLTF